MKGLWKFDLAALAVVAAAMLIWKDHLEEEERVRAVTAAGAAVAALYAERAEPLLLNPICPDQWIAQRGAGERWRVKCLTVSSVGSRAQ